MIEADIPRKEVLPPPPQAPPEVFSPITKAEMERRFAWNAAGYSEEEMNEAGGTSFRELRASFEREGKRNITRDDVMILFRIILLRKDYSVAMTGKNKSKRKINFDNLRYLNAAFPNLNNKTYIRNNGLDLEKTHIINIFKAATGHNINEYVLGGALAESIRSAQYVDGIRENPQEVLATGVNVYSGSIPAEIAENMYQDSKLAGSLDGSNKLVGGPDSLPYFLRKGYKRYEPATVATGLSEKKTWSPLTI